MHDGGVVRFCFNGVRLQQVALPLGDLTDANSRQHREWKPFTRGASTLRTVNLNAACCLMRMPTRNSICPLKKSALSSKMTISF